jgi:RNA polymerase sigma-70 factor (ECF subfamily)
MTTTQAQDEWLMAQVAAGQREPLETLVRRHATPLLTFIQRMLGDRHRSEELFQEVFLAIWLKRKQYKFPRLFRPWLYAIAINKCRASFRRKSHPTLSLHAESTPAPVATADTPSKTAMAIETASIVATAITHLPPQQRAVVVLRIWDELSYAQIAEIVGRTEATVRSHMHHGLATLRETLGPRLG